MQKVTIWLKDNHEDRTLLMLVQEFVNVVDFQVDAGVYIVRTQDGTTSTFPVHNVLATLGVAEEEG